MPKYNVKPNAGRVLVRMDVAPNKVGSLYVPETAKDNRGTTGEIVATYDSYVDDDSTYSPIFSVGDRVIFGKYVGTSISVGGEELLILKESEILASLTPAEDGVDSSEIHAAVEDV